MRQIAYADSSREPGERLDALVHAAAQLPDDVEVAISAPDGSRGRLSDIARAYGIESRVHLRAGTDVPAGAITVGPVPGSGKDAAPWLDWQVCFSSGETRRVRTMAELLDALTKINDAP